MASQPNEASRLEVVSIYKCPPKFWGAPKFGGAKHHIFTTFFATSALNAAYLWNETLHQQTKSKCQSTMCPIKVDLLSVTFDPETAEIRWLIMTHPMKIQHFPSMRGFTQRPLKPGQPNFPDVRGLKGLTINHKNFGKIRPPPKYSPLAYVP